MKLVWFEVTGFKRFAQHSKINLNEKLVAIVGPNEAGKTSLLHALMHFTNRREFINSGGSQEISRGLRMEDDSTIAEWTFAIDDDDRAALASIPEAKNLRWYSLEKKRNGKTYFSLRPRPKRSMDLRNQGRSQIAASIESLKTQVEASSDSDAEDGEEAVTPQSRLLTILQELLPELGNNEESLDNSTLTQIDDAAKMSAAMDLVELSELLTELHEYESAKSPTDRAGDAVVTGFEPLIDALELPDPDDRHVLAAAIRCGADAMVTYNLKDFPDCQPSWISNFHDFTSANFPNSESQIKPPSSALIISAGVQRR